MKTKEKKQVVTKAKKGIRVQDMLPDELKAEAQKIRAEMAMSKLEKAVQKDKNTRKAFNLRKRLARILTELNKKAIIRKLT